MRAARVLAGSVRCLPSLLAALHLAPDSSEQRLLSRYCAIGQATAAPPAAAAAAKGAGAATATAAAVDASEDDIAFLRENADAVRALATAGRRALAAATAATD